MNFSIFFTRYGVKEKYILNMPTSEEGLIDHLISITFAMWAYTPNFDHVKDVEIIIEWQEPGDPLQTKSFLWSSTDYENYRDYIGNMSSIIKLN